MDFDSKRFNPDCHILYGFGPSLNSVCLPVNELCNTLNISRNQTDVAADRSHLEAYGIDQFLCFMGCPTDPLLPI